MWRESHIWNLEARLWQLCGLTLNLTRRNQRKNLVSHTCEKLVIPFRLAIGRVGVQRVHLNANLRQSSEIDQPQLPPEQPQFVCVFPRQVSEARLSRRGASEEQRLRKSPLLLSQAEDYRVRSRSTAAARPSPEEHVDIRPSIYHDFGQVVILRKGER